MAENQILPFAQGTSANVQTQTAYAGDVQRLSGNQPGIARSAFVNKVLRQCAAVCSGVGAWAAGKQDTAITDSLTGAAFETILTNAVRASIPTSTSSVEGKIKLATAQQAQELTDTANALTPNLLYQAFYRNASLHTTGYQKLPDGLMIQWERFEETPQNVTQYYFTKTLPVAFPTAHWVTYATIFSNVSSVDAGAYVVTANTFTPTSFSGCISRVNGASMSSGVIISCLSIGF